MEPSSTREYSFTLLLSGISAVDSTVENALCKAGCDDATISVRSGRVCLTFSRAGKSLKAAILSAIRSVKESGISASVLRVEVGDIVAQFDIARRIDAGDLVTQSDIARRIGRSDQRIHEYIDGQRGYESFPPSVCCNSAGAPLWYWCEVAYWLWENDVSHDGTLREAREVSVINSVLEFEYQRQVAPSLTEEIAESLDLFKPV